MTDALVASVITGAHAHRTILDSLAVAPGDVVSVVGSNCAGNSILLQIFRWDVVPPAYNVTPARADAFVVWLTTDQSASRGRRRRVSWPPLRLSHAT